MIRILLFSILFFSRFLVDAQINSSETLIRAMQKKFVGKWCKTVTLTQTIYRPNDSLNRRMTWYEAIEYPDKLRIDINSTTKGNASLFRNDSSYKFRGRKMMEKHEDKNDLLLILGGMYFRTEDDVIKRLKEHGFDLNRFHEDTWKKEAAYVIGANKNDTGSNQIWVHKQDLRVVRTITRLTSFQQLEMRIDSYIKACGGYMENKLSFYINGKLDQQEEYKDIQTNIVITSAVFDPKHFGQVHWKQFVNNLNGNKKTK